MSGYSEMRRRSVQAIWHPYTEISSFEQSDFPIVERAAGSFLYELDGRALLDGISSWWCVNLGHSHPRLVRAIQEQAERLQHTLLGGMSHPPAIELAERLKQVTPGGLGHAMFAGDGSVAVEAALKIALQYSRYWPNTLDFVPILPRRHARRDVGGICRGVPPPLSRRGATSPSGALSLLQPLPLRFAPRIVRGEMFRLDGGACA
jgi:4-aminobutyrate aminotransferase-like enzyme